MVNKKEPMSFTIRFNPMIKTHVKAACLLNNVGRNKAHIIAEAIDLYIKRGMIELDESAYEDFPKDMTISDKATDIKSSPNSTTGLSAKHTAKDMEEDVSNVVPITEEFSSDSVAKVVENHEHMADPISNQNNDTADDDFEEVSENNSFQDSNMGDNEIAKILASMSSFNFAGEPGEDEDEE